MERWHFIKQYFTKPRTVGAILPSSRYLATKMIEDINFDRAKCIVEYGPGTGVFTDKLIKNRRNNTKILLFEENEEFCKMLEEKYKKEANLYIINDSAEFIEKHLIEHALSRADYIISGLPFASLPQDLSSRILEQTRKNLEREGKFIIFQYTMLKKNFIAQYFDEISIKWEIRNVPPAFVFCCTNLNAASL